MILGILQWKSTSFEKKLIKKTQKRKKNNLFSQKPEKCRWRNNEWIEFRASDIGHPHQHFLN